MFHINRIDIQSIRRFIRANKRLVILLAGLLLGVVFGCLLFTAYGKNESEFLGKLLAVKPPEQSIASALTALYHACFQALLLLLLLFFCGLSACGLPLVMLVPLSFGMSIGMSEAYYYSTGLKGVLITVLLLLLPTLIRAAAILMAASEAMRMTLLLAGGLVGYEKEREDGRNHFRLYLLRFAIFSLVVLGGGIVDVLLRMFCGTLLV